MPSRLVHSKPTQKRCRYVELQNGPQNLHLDSEPVTTDPARRRREIFWGFRTLFERFPKENQRFEAIILKIFASGGPIPK